MRVGAAGDAAEERVVEAVAMEALVVERVVEGAGVVGGDHERDRVGAAGDEGSGGAVGHVAGFGDRALHGGDEFRVDVADAVDNARDGCPGHTGGGGDVFERGNPTGRRDLTAHDALFIAWRALSTQLCRRCTGGRRPRKECGPPADSGVSCRCRTRRASSRTRCRGRCRTSARSVRTRSRRCRRVAVAGGGRVDRGPVGAVIGHLDLVRRRVRRPPTATGRG